MYIYIYISIKSNIYKMHMINQNYIIISHKNQENNKLQKYFKNILFMYLDEKLYKYLY